jgi:hypothetical protein
MAPASLATLERVKVGNTELEGVSVAVSDFVEQLSRAVGTEIKGIVGYNFLKAFRLTIDYPQEWIGLTVRDAA